MKNYPELLLSAVSRRKLVAVRDLILGAGGALAIGFEVGSSSQEAPVQPPAHEVVVQAPEVFQIAGKLCVDGTVYGMVGNQVEPLPNEGCSQNTTVINPDVRVGNNG